MKLENYVYAMIGILIIILSIYFITIVFKTTDIQYKANAECMALGYSSAKIVCMNNNGFDLCRDYYCLEPKISEVKTIYDGVI